MVRAKARGGITTVEFAFAVLILALALMPMYDVFTRSYRSVLESKFSYMAQHVARETMEELRHVPYHDLEKYAHDWRPVAGHVFAMSRLRSPGDASDSTLTYPEPYRRIETRIAVAPCREFRTGRIDPRLRRIVVEVRWQERGPQNHHKQKVLERFETIIGYHGS